MAELLEPVDAAFDEVSLSALVLSEGNVPGPVGFRRDNRGAALVLDQLPDPAGIVSLVSQHIGSLRQVVKEKKEAGRIVPLKSRVNSTGTAKLHVRSPHVDSR